MLLDVETQSKLVVLMFTDLAGSVDMKTRLGAHAYARIISQHDQIFKQILATTPRSQTIKDTGDGFLARFETTSDAVRAALRFQFALHHEKWDPEPARVRIGLHIGQVAELENEDATGLPKLVGLAADIAARVMDLAVPGQILMTRTLFDDGRQNIREHPPTGDDTVPQIKWMAHGPYLFKGSDEPLDVFEVGAEGIAPLSEPPDSGKARRAVRPGDEDLLGWRPAAGLEVPSRVGWILDKKLGEGGFGEVWLATHHRTKEQRVLKFCYDPDRLRSFKREMTLFRLLREALGARDDIVRLYEVRLDQPPFFLESAYSPEGDLTDWAARQGGIGKVPLATRLSLVAGIADALAAAHSVGVLHKDIKPANILIRLDKGQPQPILADFGIGMIGDMSQLANRNITMTGFTETMIEGNDSSRTGTRLYSPPELLTGKPFTVQGDIFSLGVVLYQMVVGDLSRPLAHGWESQIEDPLLRADIAACVAGDPATRLKGATELAECLRSLDARRTAKEREAHAAAAIRRRRMLVRSAVAASILLAIGAAFLLFMLARESSLRQDAEQASEDANKQRLAAEAATAQAVTARNLADTERRRAELQAYAANLAASDTALRFNDPVEARRQLELAPKEKRAWEWHYLMGRVDQSLHTINLEDMYMLSHVAWSPDGTRLACGTYSGTIIVFDAETLKEQFRFKAHPTVLNALAYSPDGKRLITSGRDNAVRLWNAANGQTSGKLPFDDDSDCRLIAHSDDHELLAVRVGLKKLHIVRVADQKILHTITNATSGGVAAFSPDKSSFVYTTASIAYVLDMATFQQTAKYDNHGAVIINILYLPDENEQVITADRRGFIHEWELKTGKSKFAYRLPKADSDMLSVAVTRNDGVIAIFEDGSIQCMLDGDEEKVITLHGHTDKIHDLAIHPTRDDLFATCAFDGTIKIWSTRVHDHGSELETYGTDAIITSRKSPRIATMNDYGLDIWNLDRESRIVNNGDVYLDELANAHHIRCAAMSNDGQRIAVAHQNGRITLWQPDKSRRPIHAWQNGSPSWRDIRFIENDKIIIAVGTDGIIHRWNTETNQPLPTVKTDAARDYQWAKKDPTTGKVIVSVNFDQTNLRWATFSDDGKFLVTHGGFAHAKIWDTQTGQLVRTLGEDNPEIIYAAVVGGTMRDDSTNTATFSDDGKLLAIGTRMGFIQWWDPATGKLLHESQGHAKSITRIAFNRDATRMVTSAADDSVRLWDATSRAQLITLRYRKLQPRMLAFDATGNRLLIGVDENVQVLDIEPLGDRMQRVQAWEQLITKLKPEIDKSFAALGSRSALIKSIADDPKFTALEREAAVTIALNALINDYTLGFSAWNTITIPNAPKETYIKELHRTRIAIEEQPIDAAFRMNEAALLYRLGQYQEALDILAFTSQMKVYSNTTGLSVPHAKVVGAFLTVACNLKLNKKEEAAKGLVLFKELRDEKKYIWDVTSTPLYDEAKRLATEAGLIKGDGPPGN